MPPLIIFVGLPNSPELEGKDGEGDRIHRLGNRGRNLIISVRQIKRL